ncbi:histidine kinase [Aquimarina sp. 2201CG5-10]|uniref:histidine kinase n=1 Tax=Aquimarina callyspongiae TaxID=3098150 RepID=UPI002AB52B5A|nr:histidine kinase [Aquimarina sp. 2201CG5-10]MDY8136012.1 histidine kinase [Aquimarina sp. 2201CG5-10]
MNLRSLSYFLLIGTMLLVSACSQNPVFIEYQTLSRIGDQPEWAAKDWNDEDWDEKKAILESGEVYWTRTPIDILKAPKPLHPYAIRPYIYGEYEVFWDGILIGKNGNPGQEATLSPEGEMLATFIIPAHLTEVGEHMLALRSSLYYFPDHVGMRVDIANYDDLLTERLIETSYMHIFAGAFLIASIYFLFLFLGNKKEYPMLIFSISCFLFFVLNLAEFITTYVPIHYAYHHIRLETKAALMFGISFLIPLYFSKQFPFPKRKILLIVYAGILLFTFFIKHNFLDFTTRNMALSMWVFSFGIAVFGIYKKMKGALLVMLTLLLSLLINFIISFQVGIFIGFSIILLGMFYLLSLRIKEQRLAYETSLVQSTRLRLELLKKNIQPHFLMNTLTSLIDWIEETPKKGVLFIEALAKEFDLFNQIENKTLIPITQEIALCRTHLEIMEYRKEIDYSWQDEGISFEETVPPGILHTLLENGITHSLPRENNSIDFKLIFESNNDYKSYTFLTYAKVITERKKKKEDGTGLKYVKARLTESYQEQWEFSSEPTDHGWKNTIKIYS